MKSVSAIVETVETVGAVLPPLQAATAVLGNPAAESNGVVVSALDTPNAIPDADVGVPDRLTVITSAAMVPVVLPYHSVWVDS
jgi:hypothetical protein